jgi:hypothetical protein
MKHLQDARLQSRLNQQVRHDGRIITRKEFLQELLADGYGAKADTVPVIEYNRRKYNNLTGKAQEDYEKRTQETKLEYVIMKANDDGYSRVAYKITKLEYDYLQEVTLINISTLE